MVAAKKESSSFHGFVKTKRRREHEENRVHVLIFYVGSSGLEIIKKGD